MRESEYLGLKLPDPEDFYDVEGQWNYNSEKLDDFAAALAGEGGVIPALQAAVAAAVKGLKLKGAVNYYTDLPTTGVQEGDAWTVLYSGTSGTEALGLEYAWAEYNNVLQWIPIGVDPSAFAKQSDLTKQNAALIEQIDGGAKNLMKLTGTNVTGYGVSCVFDAAAGTITLDGINQDKKCTGSFNVQCADSCALGLKAGTVYHFLCEGYQTSDTTIGIYVYTSGATPSQFDCYNNNEAAWNSAWEQASGFRLFIRSGTVVDNVVLKPMICSKAAWDISHKFVPYCPTLPELYAMINA